MFVHVYGLLWSVGEASSAGEYQLEVEGSKISGDFGAERSLAQIKAR